MSNVNQIIEPSDKPVARLVEHAHRAVKSWQANSGMTPRVMFKNTCETCGQRGFVESPNTVPAFVECENCGHVQPYERGGYSLGFEIDGTRPHGETADASKLVTFATPDSAKVQRGAPSSPSGIPTKIGVRCNPDASFTPIDTDALGQFVATLEAQGATKAGAK